VVNLSKDLSNMTELVLREQIKLSTEISTDEKLRESAAAVAQKGVQTAAADLDALDKRFSGIMASIGEDYEAVFLADANGVIFSDGNKGAYKGVSIANRPYFQAAKAGKNLVGNPVKSKITGDAVVPVASPVRSADGKIAGVLALIVKTDFLAEKITSVKIGETGYPFMVNKSGLVLVHPDKALVLETNMSQIAGMEEIAQAATAGRTGVMRYVYQGDDKIGGFAPVELTGWSVVTTQTADDFMKTANSIRNFITIMTIVFLGVTLLIVIFFANNISRRVMNIVDGLNRSSEQVASASSQVASTSQSLAEGSSQQASSLEETSSSLEEMAAQTRQNSGNADQAENAVKETSKVVANGVSSMERMNAAINEIKESSNETSKIIKTIDDIAFQTNLLALNAAVEAARAGEAGKGFAVVAEEVRNLAQRSAEAAQNTSQLIEKSQENANNGVAVAEEVTTQLNSIKDSAGKINTLISEIAAASKEQTQGIEQINVAVSEMDKVVQQNAADSEESASAAEELSAQATEMEKMVAALEAVVAGASEKNKGSKNLHQVSSVKKYQQKKTLNQPAQKRQNPKKLAPKAQKSHAEQVIPLDDNDFKDF